MNFKAPIWDNTKNCYEIQINPNVEFTYKSDLTTPSESIINKIVESLAEEGKQWFSSPIKSSIVLKRLVNIFKGDVPPASNNLYVYTPTLFIIYPRKFELVWDVSAIKNDIIPCNFIEFSEDLEDAPAKTIIIQENDILENVDIPFDESQEEPDHISSRAVFKQRIRHARLKAAIAAMKAEKMAEKYFRRYGIQTGLEFESDSELSLESDESESE